MVDIPDGMVQPIQYIERTRAYYLALGYDNPYQWARNDRCPNPLPLDLSVARTAVVTTAAPFDPANGDQGPGAAYNGAAKFFDVFRLPSDPVPDLRISHIAIDRAHTTAKDPASWLPVAALARTKRTQAAEFVYGFPTDRSQRKTKDQHIPDLLEWLQRDKIDAAILVPNCPVCHQSLALASHALEGAGIATVLLGCAVDIVERIKVPRFVFSDFPLGNSAGLPHDRLSQDATLDMGLDLLAHARVPTTLHSPIVWPGPVGWRDDYCNPDVLSAQDLSQRRAAFDAAKAQAAK